jgi:hypothetical protein
MEATATPAKGEIQETALRKRWEVLDRLVGNELILVSDVASGTLVYLIRQPAGRLLWQLLAEARTPKGLTQVLAQARGRIASDQDSEEVRDFLSALESAHLILAVDPAPDPSAVDPPSPLSIPPGEDLPPKLEPVDLNTVLPKDLVLQGASGGFHAAAHNMRGAGC